MRALQTVALLLLLASPALAATAAPK